jgi:hypothetical protein
LVAIACTLVIIFSMGLITKSVVVLVSIKLAKSRIAQTISVVKIPKYACNLVIYRKSYTAIYSWLVLVLK